MAQKQDGRWLVIEELLERGDPAFVDELRRIVDADALGAFAERWIKDRRSSSRRLLFAYLDGPMNAFRHNALVKRLFKLAEAAGDDALMARFLIFFDRSVRRQLAKRSRRETRTVATLAEAETIQTAWRRAGNDNVGIYMTWRGEYQVWRQWIEEGIRTPPGSAMPQGKQKEVYDRRGIKSSVSDWNLKLYLFRQRYREPSDIPEHLLNRFLPLRLYTVPTRNYLKRRSWRYFRKLGKQNPERYVPAVTEALLRYKNDDTPDSLALLDNWSLIHILFHHSPVLVSKPNGWRVASGQSLSRLKAAPIYEPLWANAPRALFQLMAQSPCQAVRSWAIQMIERHQATVAAAISLEEWLDLLGNEDGAVAALAASCLRANPRLSEVSAERWLALTESANPSSLEILVELMQAHLNPGTLTLEQAVSLAASRPLPLARLGFDLLRTKKPRTEAEGLTLLPLVEAEAEPLRPAIIRWVRETLTEALGFRLTWLLEYLDSRHRDVRAEGWKWFHDEPKARDDIELWQRLLESPYDDVQLNLITELEARVQGQRLENLEPLPLDPEAIRLLWASVLLNVHRGSRAKPLVMRQLLRRLKKRPEELASLLPLLAVSLRSTRGPEWREGLAGVVQILERNAEATSLIRAAFPELQWA